MLIPTDFHRSQNPPGSPNESLEAGSGRQTEEMEVVASINERLDSMQPARRISPLVKILGLLRGAKIGFRLSKLTRVGANNNVFASVVPAGAVVIRSFQELRADTAEVHYLFPLALLPHVLPFHNLSPFLTSNDEPHPQLNQTAIAAALQLDSDSGVLADSTSHR